MGRRISVTIDEKLLERAKQLTGSQEKTALVRVDLQAVIAPEDAKGGTEPGLRSIPRWQT
jgi:putative antitoxin of VapBC-like toxin-antitoxin system